jgi:hypothetical protein
MCYLSRNHLLSCLVLFFISCSTSAEREQEVKLVDEPVKLVINDQWVFDRVSGSVLQFKNGKGVNTKLFDLKYIGQVSNGVKIPFFIYIGRNCDKCGPDQNRIYVYSPSDTSGAEKGVSRYKYPQTWRYANGDVYYKSRVFYGQVLNDTKGLLIYQEHSTYKVNATVNKSIFIVNLNDGVKKHYMIHKETGELKETLQLLNDGRCKEILQ